MTLLVGQYNHQCTHHIFKHIFVLKSWLREQWFDYKWVQISFPYRDCVGDRVPNQVYKINTFNFSQNWCNCHHWVECRDERWIHLNQPFPGETLFQSRENFKYLHIEWVQVALKPKLRGLDVRVYQALRDKRDVQFHSISIGDCWIKFRTWTCLVQLQDLSKTRISSHCPTHVWDWR